MSDPIHRQAPLALMSTLAVRGALEAQVLPEFEARTGSNVHVSFDPTNVLTQRIAQGERADVIIAVTSCIDDLIAQGLLSAHGGREIVRTGIGIAVAQDAPIPPLDTVDDLRRALLTARSVAYSRTGASGVYFASLLKRLGIAETVDAKATVIPKGFTGECIVRGEADLAIQQLSELAIVQGIRVAAPLPMEVQSYTRFSVAAFADSAGKRSVEALLQSLDAPFARTSYLRYGLEVLDASLPARRS